jgi:hypothetical protein
MRDDVFWLEEEAIKSRGLWREDERSVGTREKEEEEGKED